MLTPKQAECLQFIDRQIAARGSCPSFDEIKDALGLKSKSGVCRLVDGLEERGFVRRLKRRSRAIEILRRPNGPALAGEDSPEAKAAFGLFLSAKIAFEYGDVAAAKVVMLGQYKAYARAKGMTDAEVDRLTARLDSINAWERHADDLRIKPGALLQ